MHLATSAERRTFLRQIALFYLIATGIAALALYLPLAGSPAGGDLWTGRQAAITIELVLGVAAAAAIYQFPWHRYHPDWFILMGMVSVAQLGVFIWATGGVASPYWPLVLFNVVGAAAYYRARWPVALMAVTSVGAVAAPLLYDRPLAPGQGTEMVVRGLVVGAAFAFSWFAAQRIRKQSELASRLLEERDAVGRRRQFVQLIGHELRTPLMLLQGYGERVARRKLPEESRQDIAAMQRNVERMARLLDDLRQYDATEHGLKLVLTRVDVGKVVEEAVAAQRELTPGRQITTGGAEAPGTEAGDGRQVRDGLRPAPRGSRVHGSV